MNALDPLPAELAQHTVDDKPYWFRLDRRDFLKLFGGGLLVCLTDLSVLAQESGRTFGSHELPDGHCGMARDCTGQQGYGFHWQGGGGTEYPHLPGAAGRGGAASSL